MASLRIFLREYCARPFGFGPSDCARMADEWIQSRAGVSPIRLLGLDWSNKEEAEAILARWPLPIQLGRAMRLAGFKSTKRPREGDVAAIAVGGAVTCAIRFRRSWWFRNGPGISSAGHPRVLRAWRVA